MKATLNEEYLETLRLALPENGYKLVADKLTRVTAETVRKVLTEPRRYKKEIIDATIEVIKEQKEIIEKQEEEIKALLG
jgi:predicted ATP-dependent protease